MADAVAAACAALGRSSGPAEQRLIKRLQANWLATAGDIAAMSAQEALALELPLRLKQVIDESVAAAGEDNDGTAASSVGSDSDSNPSSSSAAGEGLIHNIKVTGQRLGGASEGASAAAPPAAPAAAGAASIEASEAAALAALAALGASESGDDSEEEPLDPDIMRRRAPPVQRGHGRPPKVPAVLR